MTAVVPRGRLEHPDWCDRDNCQLAAVGAGMPHQSTELEVRVDGVKVGAVVLVQHAAGPVQVSLAMRGLAWSPDAAEAAGRALIRAAERARAESRQG